MEKSTLDEPKPGTKNLKLNSIKDLKGDGSPRRMPKPCEARAGHGFIGMLIGLTFLGLIVYGIYWLIFK